MSLVDLTEKGRQLFESGADNVRMSPGARLLMEVVARTGAMEEMEADWLCDELEIFSARPRKQSLRSSQARQRSSRKFKQRENDDDTSKEKIRQR
jgi:hypothetical protein